MLHYAPKICYKDVLGDTSPILVMYIVQPFVIECSRPWTYFGTKLVGQDKAVDQLKE